MTSQEQLELWLRGDSVHNPTRDECCPDFSCCEPSLQMGREERERYYKHYMDRQNGLLQPPICAGCGKRGDLRFGYCFKCASNGERP